MKHRVQLTNPGPQGKAFAADLHQDDIPRGHLLSRKEAIRTASALAQPGDIILAAGKGHEKYQEIKGVRHPFDDVAELLAALSGTTINN